MPIRFSIYYHSQENGQDLQQAVSASGAGELVEAKDLAHLPVQSLNGIDVILLEYEENNPSLDQWIEKTAANPSNPPIFLFFEEISTHCLRKALRLGARECFSLPLKEEELREAVSRVLTRLSSEAGLAKTARVVSFLGCKGGVGTTFLTANVACLLAQGHKGRVLACDLDLRYGQLSYFFDIRPQHTISEVVQNLDRLDSAYLQGIFHFYDQFLQFLPAPNRLEEAEIITPASMEKLLRYLKNNLGFQWILLDCCHLMDEVTLKALEVSDELVLVTNQSIPGLSNTRKVLEVLKLLDLAAVRTGIWLNSWEKQGDLTLSEIEDFLGMPVSGTIGFDHKQVQLSINEGKPLVTSAPRHPLCKDLKKLAGEIRGAEPEDETNSLGGWLKRLWSRS